MDGHLPGTRLMLANLYMKEQKWQTAMEQFDAYLIENPRAADRAQIEETRSKVAQRVRGQ